MCEWVVLAYWHIGVYVYTYCMCMYLVITTLQSRTAASRSYFEAFAIDSSHRVVTESVFYCPRN